MRVPTIGYPIGGRRRSGVREEGSYVGCVAVATLLVTGRVQ